MGVSISNEIIQRGGEVTLLYGKGATAQPPSQANVIIVESTKNFIDALTDQMAINTFDVLISTAALADFTPEKIIEKKISSDEHDTLQISLKSTKKLIKKAKELDKNLYVVAFKAETDFTNEDLIEKAYSRLQSSKIDLIVANNVSGDDTERGFESDSNEMFIINSKKEVTHLQLAQKSVIGAKIIDLIYNKIK